MYEIQLTATDSNWRLFHVRKADKAFLAFQNKVTARDGFTCQYCGFCAKQHLEVINRDGNYRNNREDNLVTACGFCAQCFFLESIGKGDFGGGLLIYLPEMTQTQLNALCHVLFTTMVTNMTGSANARNVYRSFKLRSQIIEKQLGEGFSNPALLGRLWVDAPEKDVTALHQILLPNIRLLPELSRFVLPVTDWAETALHELTYETSH